MTESNTISQIDSNKLDFIPLGICENIAGNYDNYLQTTMSHIIKIKKFEKNKFGTSPIPLLTPSPSRNFFKTAFPNEPVPPVINKTLSLNIF